MEKLKGTLIKGIIIKFENIVIITEDKSYYISSEELIKILSEFDFDAEKKITRTWLHVNIDDWRIEKFDEPRTY